MILILLLFFLNGVQGDFVTHACSVLMSVDQAWNEKWDFTITGWNGLLQETNPIPINRVPFDGNWSFAFTFCGSILAKQGNLRPKEFSFGRLFSFDFADPDRNISVAKEFTQVYKSGDTPASCPDGLQANINLWCGNDKNSTCSQVPGGGSKCIAGPDAAQFCICSIDWTGPLCTSLTFNLLSRNCPEGVPIPVNEPQSDTAAIVFVSLFAFAFALFLTGIGYRYLWLGRRGSEVIPFYDECNPVRNPSNPAAGTVTGGTGSMRGAYQTL